MFSMNLNDIIVSTCRSLGEIDKHCHYEYDDGQYTATGMFFEFAVELNSFDNEKEYSSDRQNIYILVVGHRGWVKTEPFAVNSKFTTIGWKYTGDHDSCWHYGIRNEITDVYFSLAEQLNQRRQEAGLSTISPVEMSQYVSTWDKLFQPIKVQWHKTKKQRENVLDSIVVV